MFLPIPQYILELERFGVGDFSPAEVAAKCAQVRALMAARPDPPRPLFTVAVPAYKEERSILATLRSLAEQTHADCEFLIVSNGEPAGNPTQTIAETCGFTVIHDPLPGIARARQTALAAARGQIMVTTDADTLHSSGWLDAIARLMRNPEIRCGSGMTQALSQSAPARLVWAYLAFCMRLQQGISPRLLKGIFEANAFFYRDEGLAAGGFDTSLRLGEGIRLFTKLRRPGQPLLFFDPGLTVYSSARRPEQQGPLRWAFMLMVNGLIQAFGGKGLGEKSYPDIR